MYLPFCSNILSGEDSDYQMGMDPCLSRGLVGRWGSRISARQRHSTSVCLITRRFGPTSNAVPLDGPWMSTREGPSYKRRR